MLKKLVSLRQPAFPKGLTLEAIILRYKRENSFSGCSGISWLDSRMLDTLVSMLADRFEPDDEVSEKDLEDLTLGELATLWESNRKDVREWLIFRGASKSAGENYGYPFNVKSFGDLTTKDQLELIKRKRLVKQIMDSCDEKDRKIFTQRLTWITNRALEVIAIMNSKARRLLFGFIDTLDNDRHIGASIIKGFFFIFRSFKSENIDPKVLLTDIAFEGVEGSTNRLLKETICELFGQFIQLEDSGGFSLSPTDGLRTYISKIATEIKANRFNLGSSNVLKGIVGELLVAYYFKFFGSTIVGFDVKVDDRLVEGNEVDMYIIDKNNNLLSIEVKNWEVNSLEKAEQLVSKISRQLSNEARVKKDEQMRIRLGAKAVKRVGILVRETDGQENLRQLAREQGFDLMIIPLCPRWVAKGEYRIQQ